MSGDDEKKNYDVKWGDVGQVWHNKASFLPPFLSPPSFPPTAPLFARGQSSLSFPLGLWLSELYVQRRPHHSLHSHTHTHTIKAKSTNTNGTATALMLKIWPGAEPGSTAGFGRSKR